MEMKTLRPLKGAVLILGVAIASALLMACSGSEAASSHGAAHAGAARTAPRDALHDNMRFLWEEHIAWTRLAIVSIAGGLPDSAATTERLLRNQADIGDAIKPYYGEEAGKRLTALLKDHIVIAADLVTAAKTGDSAAVERGKASWYANADEIGAFLGAANPGHWQQAEMKAMMRDHLDLTLQEAVNYLTGDHKASVADYDRIHTQILHMADMLTDGIAAQFPQEFNGSSNGR